MSYGGFTGNKRDVGITDNKSDVGNKRDVGTIGSSLPPSSSPDDNAVYGAPSATLTLLTKFSAVFTVLMMVLSFIFCLALGKSDGTDYLLATNIVISAIVGMTVAWWHKSGDLAGDKLWFLLVVCVVIVFQCLTTDIYVFHTRSPAPTPITPTTSPVPPVTIHMVHQTFNQ